MLVSVCTFEYYVGHDKRRQLVSYAKSNLKYDYS